MSISITERYSPLDLSHAVVLLTGGASGIGFGLAQEFIKAGSTVIITGRREGALKEAQEKLPGLHIKVGDVGKASDRKELATWAAENFPKLNILVNNAGIQRRVALAEDHDWSERQLEIDINCSGPVHLIDLLTPHLLKQPEAAIINITSSLGFIPCAFGPTYGATKAFMHSWTVAARPSYAKTNIRIFEIVPPAVKSNLGGSHDYGEPTDEFCAAVFRKFTEGEKEIGYNMSDEWRAPDRLGNDKIFQQQTQRTFDGKYKVFEK